MRAIVVAILLSACAPVTHAGQDEATAIVWAGAYERTDAPPVILWEDAPCGPDGSAGVEYEGKCYWDVASDDGSTCRIAWRGSFSGSAFAHSFLHAKQVRADDLHDAEHLNREWGEQFGHPRGLLDFAGDKLRGSDL